jgi:hypothetical protein
VANSYTLFFLFSGLHRNCYPDGAHAVVKLNASKQAKDLISILSWKQEIKYEHHVY